MTNRRLTRSVRQRQVAGVCAGIARAFNIDVTLVRLVFIVLAISGGPGLLLYIALWIFLPAED